jgi:ABC-type branched-subunit amino acid transport system ATPase component
MVVIGDTFVCDFKDSALASRCITTDYKYIINDKEVFVVIGTNSGDKTTTILTSSGKIMLYTTEYFGPDIKYKFIRKISP